MADGLNLFTPLGSISVPLRAERNVMAESKFFSLTLVALAWAGVVPVVSADALDKDELAAVLPGVAIDHIADSPISGIYEIAVGTNVAYVSDDGKYLLQGELFDLDSSENLTELSRSKARVDLLASVDPDTMIVFGPEDKPAEHRVIIFTDIDCGYCRKLHQEIKEINALGIEVEYLFFPRSGPGTESWSKAGDVWCAQNRNEALTAAKAGSDVTARKCEGTPVQTHYDLGQRVGVRGTPAIFSESGVQLGGYLPAEALLGRLEALKN
jgi:thiol:disulfide interchange protein DsbC